MKMNDAFSYDVSSKEDVNITVTPRNFRDSLFSIRAERDGKPFPNEAGTDNAPVYKFQVTKPVNASHRVMMEFTFIDGSPDQAMYEVTISGKNDEGCPCGFSIDKDTQDKSPDIEFFVAA